MKIQNLENKKYLDWLETEKALGNRPDLIFALSDSKYEKQALGTFTNYNIGRSSLINHFQYMSTPGFMQVGIDEKRLIIENILLRVPYNENKYKEIFGEDWLTDVIIHTSDIIFRGFIERYSFTLDSMLNEVTIIVGREYKND